MFHVWLPDKFGPTTTLALPEPSVLKLKIWVCPAANVKIIW